MRISKIAFENFRCFTNEQIELDTRKNWVDVSGGAMMPV